MKHKYTWLGLFALFLVATGSYAALSLTVPCPATGTFQNFTFFSATTTTATSTNLTGGGGFLNLACAKKVTLYVSRGDTSGQGNSGSTEFRFQVTPDGSNWYYLNRLRQNLATTTSDETIPSSIVVPSGTSTAIVYPDFRSGSFLELRCIAIESTDGEHTCKASVEY